MEITETQFALQTVVAGKRRIFTIPNVCKIAIGTFTGKTGGSRSRAWRYARGNERTESVGDQSCQRRIGVNGLEITDLVVAYIAGLKYDLAGNFVLHAQRPVLCVRFMEISCDLRKVATSWIAAARNIAQMRRTHVAS